MAGLPRADRIVSFRKNQYFEPEGADTCLPVTLMNASRQVSGKNFADPAAVLLNLDRIGPTNIDGTQDPAIPREAAALGMGVRQLGRNFTLARQLSLEGVPIAADINPGWLPKRVQIAAGGTFDSYPAGHEVLLLSMDAQGGAVVEDPELGRYTLTAQELKRVVGTAGELRAFPPKNGWVPA